MRGDARLAWNVERLIGSIRRECLDHIVVVSEAHLRRILTAYGTYYNRALTHLALGKDRKGFGRCSAWLSGPIVLPG